MTTYNKGMFFGGIIGSIVSCVVTHFYIRKNYLLVPLDLTKYITHIPKKI